LAFRELRQSNACRFGRLRSSILRAQPLAAGNGEMTGQERGSDLRARVDKFKKPIPEAIDAPIVTAPKGSNQKIFDVDA